MATSNTKDQKPSACLYCSHYNGSNYGGNFLVCAMHPKGPKGDKCEDHSLVH